MCEFCGEGVPCCVCGYPDVGADTGPVGEGQDALLCDVRYAIRQLRRFGDVGRALDALERVEAELSAP